MFSYQNTQADYINITLILQIIVAYNPQQANQTNVFLNTTTGGPDTRSIHEHRTNIFLSTVATELDSQ